MNDIDGLLKIYKEIKPQIISRLAEFERVRKSGSNIDILKELIFCILTPQSNAIYCWQAVEKIFSKNLFLDINKKIILEALSKVRFKYKKTDYVIEAFQKFGKGVNLRDIFYNNKISIQDKRNWLIKNVKGYGLKEASHFLRNIGLGKNIAILDRHILKNLYFYKVIDCIPKSVTKKTYYEIEKKMEKFSKNINIPMDELDLLFWFKETGKIFK